MKKTILLLATIAFAASCIEDSRNNFMVPDTLSLVYDEAVVPVSVYSGSATVTVQKAGKGVKPATATIGVSAEALAEYNAENGTAFTSLSSNLYEFSANEVSIKAEDLTGSIKLEWNPSSVYPALDGSNSVIPVVITESSLSVNPKRNLVLVNLLNSQVGLASSGSSLVAKEDENEDSEVSLKISVDNILPVDLDVTLAVDNNLIAAFNAEKGTTHIAAPNAFVKLPTEGVSVKAGQTDCFCTVTLDNSALFSGGKMMNFTTLLIPIKISATSQAGVAISDKVYYLVVRSPFDGVSISRVWGKYSLDKLWTADYGLPSGVDRTLTVDANWVYIPYAIGGSTAKITAISITDPTNTMQVNCEGFVANTITTACVRIIDKGDGTPMLTASGANEGGSFAFYTWPNGTDKAPTRTTLQCTWRRGGDRYELHGTWADGMVYVHAFQGTFSTRYEVKNGAFVKTDRTLVNVPFTGFGGVYKHPDYDQMLFASSDTSAFLTPTGTTYKQGDGQDTHDMAFEKYEDGALTYGYRPFTFKDEKYIAYTAIEGETLLRATLYIVKDKGGFKASLAGDEKDIFFEAPIHSENAEDMAIQVPMSLQGDCAVFVMPDKVWIAAGAQGLGVSVFKME
ncbi:MAG: DUF1735 domain-containing protein [Bacteroidales bacterium]|nr:DUF1735 domain-containing protein [Bacteroidales bacterium]